MSPVTGKRHDCETRVHTGRRSGTNTARQSPVFGTRYASALLSQQSKGALAPDNSVKYICHGRYVNGTEQNVKSFYAPEGLLVIVTFVKDISLYP
jgi:hypothetical protein